MAAIKSTLALHSNSTTIPFGLNFSRASSASRVNALGLVETIAAGNIRLDYNPSVPGQIYGWLLEETSTNSFLKSQNFAQTWTVAGDGAVVSDTDKAPDGVASSADTLKSSTGGTVRVAVAQAGLTFVDGTKYTVSVWAKKKELDYLEISDKLNATGVTYAKTFKISDGTLGVSDGAVVDATIKAYPNDWYRCTVTFTAGAGMTTVFLKARSDNDTSTTSSVTQNHGISLWGAQVEAKEYATSYMPTTTVTTTRSADVAYIQEENPSWNWDVGTTLFINAIPLYTGGTNKPIYHYQDSDNENFVTLLNTGNVKIFSNSVNQLDADPFTTGFSMSDRTQFKNMIALKKDSAHMAQNGALSTTLAADTNIIVPLNSSSHTYTIKFFHGTGLTSSSGWLKDFLIWSNTVADDVLESDTLVGTGAGTTNASLYNQISDLSVTEAKIADGAVTTNKIADNAITTDKIAFEVIVADDLDANAITVSKIQDGAVATDKIADNAVTGAKIAMGSDAAGDVLYYSGTDYVKLAKGNNGEVLTLASGLPSWAPDSTDVAGTTIGGVSGDLSGTVATATINNGAITNAKLGADAVDGTKLQDNAIDSEHYTDLSIDTAHIADLQVTNGKIANATITGAKIAAVTIESGNIASNAVSNTKILNNAVTTAKVADNQITIGKLAVTDGTNGQILSTDGNGTLSFVDDTDTTIGDAAVGGDVTGTISNIQVTWSGIPNNTITTAMIAADVIVAEDIANNAITIAELNVNSVNLSKLVTTGSAPTAGQILSHDGSGNFTWVDDTDTTIGDAAVGGDVTGTISNIQVTWSGIPNNTITSAMIASGVIVSQDIAANAVNGTHIAMGSDVAGDTLYYNGTDYVRLPKGTDGEVLTLASGVPSWAADSTNVGTTAVGGMLSGTVANASIAAGVVTPTMLSATGTASNSTFLRGDGVWAAPAMTETDPTAVTMAIALG